MMRVEKILKKSRFRPIRIAGEIAFGTQGEHWEAKRLNGVVV
ncbi:MAG: hypothetical protein V1822_00905 [Candidatus Micrarchaeota archaeon]